MSNLIYAVDDEEMIRELYKCLIEQAGHQINCFEDGYQMFEALKHETPDLFILDIMLDNIDGYEILKRIRQDNRFITIPVIMVSAKGEEISKVKGLNLGADDYISKPFGVMEFIARVNAKLRVRNITQNNSDLYTYQDITIDNQKHEVIINDQIINLSITEYNLLLYLVKNNNKAISREELWENVWKEDFTCETRSLDMHITKLRKLLNNSNVKIESIRTIGYKLR